MKGSTMSTSTAAAATAGTSQRGRAEDSEVGMSVLATRPRYRDAGTNPGAGLLRDGGEVAGPLRVAAEGRAVGLERAPVAEARRPRPEVVAVAGPLDRFPDGLGPHLQPADRLLGRHGDDGQRLAQVE